MDFFDLFGDVLFYPLTVPVDIVDNPLLLSCTCVLIGLSVAGTFLKIYHAFF